MRRFPGAVAHGKRGPLWRPWARYIRLSPSGTIKNPNAQTGGTFYLSGLEFVHASDCPLFTTVCGIGPARRRSTAAAVGSGTAGETSTRSAASSGSPYTWYDGSSMRQQFVRSYHA